MNNYRNVNYIYEYEAMLLLMFSPHLLQHHDS